MCSGMVCITSLSLRRALTQWAEQEAKILIASVTPCLQKVTSTKQIVYAHVNGVKVWAILLPAVFWKSIHASPSGGRRSGCELFQSTR